MNNSDKIGYSKLGFKENPYWEILHVDNYILPIIHNETNLGTNGVYMLFHLPTSSFSTIYVFLHYEY